MAVLRKDLALDEDVKYPRRQVPLQSLSKSDLFDRYPWQELLLPLDESHRGREKCSKCSEGGCGWRSRERTFGSWQALVNACCEHLRHFSQATASRTVVLGNSCEEELAFHPVDGKSVQDSMDEHARGDTATRLLLWTGGGGIPVPASTSLPIRSSFSDRRL